MKLDLRNTTALVNLLQLAKFLFDNGETELYNKALDLLKGLLEKDKGVVEVVKQQEPKNTIEDYIKKIKPFQGDIMPRTQEKPPYWTEKLNGDNIRRTYEQGDL